jgi:histidinol phosphatase-like PHP family hydrolase
MYVHKHVFTHPHTLTHTHTHTQVSYLRKLQKEESARKDAQSQLQTLSTTYNQLHTEHFQMAKMMSNADRNMKQTQR